MTKQFRILKVSIPIEIYDELLKIKHSSNLSFSAIVSDILEKNILFGRTNPTYASIIKELENIISGNGSLERIHEVPPYPIERGDKKTTWKLKNHQKK